jgi:hypothetical protein
MRRVRTDGAGTSTSAHTGMADGELEQNQGYCSLISLVEGRRSLLVAST